MRGALRLGRFAGVDVLADASVGVLVLLFSIAAFFHLRAVVPDSSPEAAGAFAAASGLAAVLLVFFHEVGHVVVALKRGLAVRSIRLHLYGGYSVIDGVPSPGTEFIVAMAGPIVSVFIGITIIAVQYFVDFQGLGRSTLLTIGLASIGIGLFNLLPGFPLDGGRVVRAILTGAGVDRLTATKKIVLFGRILGVASAVIGMFLLMTRDIWGVFWLAAGWFVAASAGTAGKREEVSVAYDGLTMADVMRPTPEAVDGNATISTMLGSGAAAGPRLRSLPVSMDGRVIGVIGQEEIDSVAPSRWPSMRVRALMLKIGPDDVVGVADPYEMLVLHGTSRPKVVIRDGVVVGIIDGQSQYV